MYYKLRKEFHETRFRLRLINCVQKDNMALERDREKPVPLLKDILKSNLLAHAQIFSYRSPAPQLTVKQSEW